MTSVPDNNEFLFLMRGADWDKGLSPHEAQTGMEAMLSWLDDLTQRGLLQGGQPLDFKGTVVRSKDDVVMDGPYIESKEAVGGYLLIHAKSHEEALEAARSCPVLKFGLVIEVRPTLVNCHVMDDYGLSYADSMK